MVVPTGQALPSASDKCFSSSEEDDAGPKVGWVDFSHSQVTSAVAFEGAAKKASPSKLPMPPRDTALVSRQLARIRAAEKNQSKEAAMPPKHTTIVSRSMALIHAAEENEGEQLPLPPKDLSPVCRQLANTHANEENRDRQEAIQRSPKSATITVTSDGVKNEQSQTPQSARNKIVPAPTRLPVKEKKHVWSDDQDNCHGVPDQMDPEDSHLLEGQDGLHDIYSDGALSAEISKGLRGKSSTSRARKCSESSSQQTPRNGPTQEPALIEAQRQVFPDSSKEDSGDDLLDYSPLDGSGESLRVGKQNPAASDQPPAPIENNELQEDVEKYIWNAMTTEEKESIAFEVEQFRNICTQRAMKAIVAKSRDEDGDTVSSSVAGDIVAAHERYTSVLTELESSFHADHIPLLSPSKSDTPSKSTKTLSEPDKLDESPKPPSRPAQERFTGVLKELKSSFRANPIPLLRPSKIDTPSKSASRMPRKQPISDPENSLHSARGSEMSDDSVKLIEVQQQINNVLAVESVNLDDVQQQINKALVVAAEAKKNLDTSKLHVEIKKLQETAKVLRIQSEMAQQRKKYLKQNARGSPGDRSGSSGNSKRFDESGNASGETSPPACFSSPGPNSVRDETGNTSGEASPPACVSSPVASSVRNESETSPQACFSSPGTSSFRHNTSIDSSGDMADDERAYVRREESVLSTSDSSAFFAASPAKCIDSLDLSTAGNDKDTIIDALHDTKIECQDEPIDFKPDTKTTKNDTITDAVHGITPECQDESIDFKPDTKTPKNDTITDAVHDITPECQDNFIDFKPDTKAPTTSYKDSVTKRMFSAFSSPFRASSSTKECDDSSSVLSAKDQLVAQQQVKRKVVEQIRRLRPSRSPSRSPASSRGGSTNTSLPKMTFSTKSEIIAYDFRTCPTVDQSPSASCSMEGQEVAFKGYEPNFAKKQGKPGISFVSDFGKCGSLEARGGNGVTATRANAAEAASFLPFASTSNGSKQAPPPVPTKDEDMVDAKDKRVELEEKVVSYLLDGIAPMKTLVKETSNVDLSRSHDSDRLDATADTSAKEEKKELLELSGSAANMSAQSYQYQSFTSSETRKEELFADEGEVSQQAPSLDSIQVGKINFFSHNSNSRSLSPDLHFEQLVDSLVHGLDSHSMESRFGAQKASRQNDSSPSYSEDTAVHHTPKTRSILVETVGYDEEFSVIDAKAALNVSTSSERSADASYPSHPEKVERPYNISNSTDRSINGSRSYTDISSSTDRSINVSSATERWANVTAVPARSDTVTRKYRTAKDKRPATDPLGGAFSAIRSVVTGMFVREAEPELEEVHYVDPKDVSISEGMSVECTLETSRRKLLSENHSKADHDYKRTMHAIPEHSPKKIDKNAGNLSRSPHSQGKPIGVATEKSPAGVNELEVLGTRSYFDSTIELQSSSEDIDTDEDSIGDGPRSLASDEQYFEDSQYLQQLDSEVLVTPFNLVRSDTPDRLGRTRKARNEVNASGLDPDSFEDSLMETNTDVDGNPLGLHIFSDQAAF